MCGISCCISLSGSTLGHVRLSINDLSPTGAQPFHSPDDQIHAVINGELYGHEELRAHLQSQQDFTYTFQGSSDCEIVIALYQYYGLSFLEHLRGEFSLVLWDAKERLLLAARDRYGIKPLFYTIDAAGRLLVAAEIKAFIPMGWKAEWDVRSIRDGGWNFDDRTIFNGVRKIRPGHYLLCRSYEREFEQRAYWDMSYPDKNLKETRSEQEMIEGVRQHLIEAVRLRLRADVPVGVYLSGGIDSSAIAGIMTHLVRERGEQIGNDKETDRISCFSIAFDEDSGFDESAIANRTADFLNVKYYKKHMSEAELACRFEEATWHCEHTNSDLNYIGKFALSDLPRQLGFKVVLTGEGSDEHFAGYPMYAPDYLREPDPSWPAYDQLPEAQRQALCAAKDKEAETYYNSIGADGSNRFNGVSILSRRVLNGITTPCSMTAFSTNALLAPWTSQLGECNQQMTIANGLSGESRATIFSKWHPLHSAMYTWTKGHLSNIFLSSLGDRTEMAHSLEARTPFLDHKLTEYVNNIPPSLKLRYQKPSSPAIQNNHSIQSIPEVQMQEEVEHETSASHPSSQHVFIEKSILRAAVRPFVTDEIYTRTKHPYSAPTRYTRGGPLHVLFSRLITQRAIEEELGFVDWSVARDLVARAFDGDSEGKGDDRAMRLVFVLPQWIVLARRFGVACARQRDYV